ncbi:MAG: OmpP1/FadL family transporter [Panacagrimonas sp.]
MARHLDRRRGCAATLLLGGVFCWASLAQAGGSGLYTNGSGIKSLGAGGLSLVLAEDSYTLASNPAGASAMGWRQDYGLDFQAVQPEARISGNLLGPDKTFGSRLHGFFIPQGGFARPLSERVSIGATAFYGGFGTEYEPSPYRRFLGQKRASIQLLQAGVSFAAAYLVAPRQSLGLALNLSYQMVEVEGVQSFALLLPSENRRHFSNQGIAGAPGLGFTLGWLGEITPQLLGALAYRSKTWSRRIKEYEGLLPEQGRVEFPQNLSAGLLWEFVPGAYIGYEFQRVFYTSEAATGNSFDGQIIGAEPFGSDHGPGFGWNNQNLHRLGLGWRCTERLSLRAGHADATQNVPASQTLLAALAPSISQRHYTLGATYRFASHWELSGYWSYSPHTVVRGEGSIPLLIGGGEADIDLRSTSMGFSFGRRFGD